MTTQIVDGEVTQINDEKLVPENAAVQLATAQTKVRSIFQGIGRSINLSTKVPSGIAARKKLQDVIILLGKAEKEAAIAVKQQSEESKFHAKAIGAGLMRK